MIQYISLYLHVINVPCLPASFGNILSENLYQKTNLCNNLFLKIMNFNPFPLICWAINMVLHISTRYYTSCTSKEACKQEDKLYCIILQTIYLLGVVLGSSLPRLQVSREQHRAWPKNPPAEHSVPQTWFWFIKMNLQEEIFLTLWSTEEVRKKTLQIQKSVCFYI